MKLKIIRNELDEILKGRMCRVYRVKDMERSYCDLEKLKEKFINISLINLNKEDIEELDYIRFRILEEMCLVNIDLAEFNGIDTRVPYQKLEELYSQVS